MRGLEAGSFDQMPTSRAESTLDHAIEAAKHGDCDALRYVYIRCVDEVIARIAPHEAPEDALEGAAAVTRICFTAAQLRRYEPAHDGSLVEWLARRAAAELVVS